MARCSRCGQRNHLMDKGDIYLVDLDPTIGHEQRGKRRVMVVSSGVANRLTGLAVIVPVAGGGEFARNRGFAVSLTGAGMTTDGVVLCSQMRTIDLRARGGKKLEKAPSHIVDEVVAAVVSLFE